VKSLRPTHHEAFNTLKTKGYNLEHNFGHGTRHLASVLATLNLLAFACHTVCDLGDKTWRAARRELVTRREFFHTMLALTKYLLFRPGITCWGQWLSPVRQHWHHETVWHSGGSMSCSRRARAASGHALA